MVSPISQRAPTRLSAQILENGILSLAVLLPELLVDAHAVLGAARTVVRTEAGTAGAGLRLLLKGTRPLVSETEYVDYGVVYVNDTLLNRLLCSSAGLLHMAPGGWCA